MTLKKMTSEDLIKLEETLSRLKIHYLRKGAEDTHRLIVDKIKNNKSIRDASVQNAEDFWKGYDKAVSDILSLIRDGIIFK